MKRDQPLETHKIYHIYNRSIAGYVIFNNVSEYERMLQTISYYRFAGPLRSLSEILKVKSPKLQVGEAQGQESVKIVSYCLMPTHYHLVLEQCLDEGVERFIGNVQNSYSRYFNLKHDRGGPLWESRFKNKIVESSDELLNLTRYVHRNPCKARLVNDPVDWHFSSYRNFIEASSDSRGLLLDLSRIDLLGDRYREYYDNYDPEAPFGW